MKIILILAIITAAMLVLIILVQNPKGGGLASNFSSGNQIFGVQKTNELIEKLTWGFGIALVVFSLLASSYATPPKKGAANGGATQTSSSKLSPEAQKTLEGLKKAKPGDK